MIFKRRDRDPSDGEETPSSDSLAVSEVIAVDQPATAQDSTAPSAVDEPENGTVEGSSDAPLETFASEHVPSAPSQDRAIDGSDEEEEAEELPLLPVDEDEEDDEAEEDMTPPVEADIDRSKRPVRPLPRVIAIANQKGGVGKTTTTINLSAGLAELGYRVLVIDLDPQGNATTGLGIDARNFEMSMYDVLMRDADLADAIEPTSTRNLFLAPATIDLAGVEIELVPAFSREQKLKRAVEGVIEDFDFIMIDCPPSLGLITINGLAAATEVLVPIQCEYYALEGLGQLLRNVKLVASNLNPSLEVSTIVLTMYDGRTRLAADVANEVRSHFPNETCDSVIPRTVRLSEAPSFGQPITSFDPSSRGARAYRNLAREVSDGATKRTR